MDLADASAEGEDEGAGAAGEGAGAGPEEDGRRTLDEEPWMAARVLIEDSMCILLDVDDVDRYKAQYDPNSDTFAAFKQTRDDMLAFLASSLCLPSSSAQQPSSDDPSGEGLVKLLVKLARGRGLLARFIELLPLHSASVELVWKLLRHLNAAFGEEDAGSRDPSSVRLGGAVARTLAAMDVAGVSTSMACLLTGDCGRTAHFPLSQTQVSGPGNAVICALLERAAEPDLGLVGQGIALQGPMAASWQQAMGAFFMILVKHLQKLKAALAESPGADLSAAVPVDVIRCALPHATDQQRNQLRSLLVSFS